MLHCLVSSSQVTTIAESQMLTMFFYTVWHFNPHQEHTRETVATLLLLYFTFFHLKCSKKKKMFSEVEFKRICHADHALPASSCTKAGQSFTIFTINLLSDNYKATWDDFAIEMGFPSFFLFNTWSIATPELTSHAFSSSSPIATMLYKSLQTKLFFFFSLLLWKVWQIFYVSVQST